MKKISAVLFFCFLFSFLAVEALAQATFNTGAIGVNQSNGGRTRVLSVGTTRQIDRTSILVSVSKTQVYDYNQDQDVLEAATLVASPLSSDFEITSALNNAYSNLPPNVEARLNIYGWTNGGYLLVKVNIKNKEAAAINATFGLEIIPQVDNTYGSEVIEWDAASGSVLIHKTSWVGYKFFSAPQQGLKSFRWFDGYGTDSSYFEWLSQTTFDPVHNADPVDGAVAVFGVAPVVINPEESTDFYYGISLGTDKASCLANLSDAAVKYNLLVPVELTSFAANVIQNNVQLNWSTSTEVNNRGFEVERRVQNSEWVTIGFREGAGTSTEEQKYAFTDNISGITSERLYYRLKQVDFDGSVTYTEEIEVLNRMAPDHFVLEQNYPNPFNPETKIAFGIPEKSNVSLKVFNSLGEEVAVVTSGIFEAGTYSFNFNASSLSSGIYICVLQSGNNVISKKMSLLK